MASVFFEEGKTEQHRQAAAAPNEGTGGKTGELFKTNINMTRFHPSVVLLFPYYYNLCACFIFKRLFVHDNANMSQNCEACILHLISLTYYCFSTTSKVNHPARMCLYPAPHQ